MTCTLRHDDGNNFPNENIVIYVLKEIPFYKGQTKFLLNFNIQFTGNNFHLSNFCTIISEIRVLRIPRTGVRAPGKGSELENAMGGVVVTALYSYHYYDGG